MKINKTNYCTIRKIVSLYLLEHYLYIINIKCKIHIFVISSALKRLNNKSSQYFSPVCKSAFISVNPAVVSLYKDRKYFDCWMKTVDLKLRRGKVR